MRFVTNCCLDKNHSGTHTKGSVGSDVQRYINLQLRASGISGIVYAGISDEKKIVMISFLHLPVFSITSIQFSRG